MFLKRLGLAALVIGAGAGAAACTDGYGYQGVTVGYGAGPYGYGDPYGYDYADPYYGYGGSSYFGWWGDYYYPGTGAYVYDRYRRPYRWNDSQRRYWQGRREGFRGGVPGGNWNGFGRGPGFRDGGNQFPAGDARNQYRPPVPDAGARPHWNGQARPQWNGAGSRGSRAAPGGTHGGRLSGRRH